MLVRMPLSKARSRGRSGDLHPLHLLKVGGARLCGGALLHCATAPPPFIKGVGGGAAPQTAAAGAILLPFRGGLSFMAIMRSGSSCP